MSNTIETWKPIPGYDTRYEYSSNERLKSKSRTIRNVNNVVKVKKEKIHNMYRNQKGYQYFCLIKDGKKKHFSLAKLNHLVFGIETKIKRPEPKVQSPRNITNQMYRDMIKRMSNCANCGTDKCRKEPSAKFEVCTDWTMDELDEYEEKGRWIN